MPTPEASAIADYLYHRGERTAIAYEDRGDIAEALDRFAAQRGADEGERIAQEWAAIRSAMAYVPGARLATILDHATAADPSGVLLYFHTPAEAEAFLAYYTRSVCDGAPPQTGGGDAGERARALYLAVICEHIDAPITEAKVIIPAIEAALRSSHREGAEAALGIMRTVQNATASPFYTDKEREAVKHCFDTVREGIADLRALPIPGSKTDAG